MRIAMTRECEIAKQRNGLRVIEHSFEPLSGKIIEAAFAVHRAFRNLRVFTLSSFPDSLAW